MGLTEDQRDQLKAILKPRFDAMRQDSGGERPHHGHARGAKLMEAFKQDRFVMDEVAPPGDVAAGARSQTDQVLGVLESSLPILTPAQRAIVAQKLRDRAAAFATGAPDLLP